MRNESSEQVWTERLRAQAGSGLTIRAWCAQEQLKESSFHYWRKRLAVPPGTGFIALPLAGSDTAAALELRTPEGYLIRVSSQAQVGWLGGVLAALR